MSMTSILFGVLSLALAGVGLYLFSRGWVLHDDMSLGSGSFGSSRITIGELIKLYGRWPTRIGLIGFGLVLVVFAIGMGIFVIDPASPLGLQLTLGVMLVVGLPFGAFMLLGAGWHQLSSARRNPDPYLETEAVRQSWLPAFGHKGTRTIMSLGSLISLGAGLLILVLVINVVRESSQPPTFETFADTQMNIQGIAPAESGVFEWKNLGQGIYEPDQRVTPPRLPDRMHIQGSRLSPQEWLVDLNNEYHFATPPAPAGEREANGLTWKLYTTTTPGSSSVGGNTVDIALAESDGSTEPLTLLVVLITTPLGHDSFYEELFLPVVDALVPLR